MDAKDKKSGRIERKRRGRLSAEELRKEPQFKETADEWLRYIGTVYGEYFNRYSPMLAKDGIMPDLINDTLLSCYDSIKRNGLKDMTGQGMRNYWFRSLMANRNMADGYAKRKDGNAVPDILDEPASRKAESDLLKDFAVIRLMEKAEHEFQGLTFSCFRLKHMVPGMTYQRLRSVTGVKDCKKRCLEVLHWLRENASWDGIMEEFDTYYGHDNV